MWPKLGSVPTYGPVYLTALLLHLFLALVWARKLHLRWYVGLVAGLSFMVGMTLGAKVLFDFKSHQFALAALLSPGHWVEGGMWGGPLAYLALAVPLMLMLARDRRAGVDLVAVTMPLPMILAKVACLCNGCCHGRPTDGGWGLSFPPGGAVSPAGVPLHPTQVYEMFVLLVAAIVLTRLRGRIWRGTKLFWFLAMYGFGRAMAEFFRGDTTSGDLWGPLTYSQWACLAASFASMVVLVAWRRGAGLRAQMLVGKCAAPTSAEAESPHSPT